MPDLIFDYWNSQPNLRKHKTDSKVYSEYIKYVDHLLNGSFGNRYTLTSFCIEMNNLSEEELGKKWTQEEIKDAIEKFNFMCGSDYSGDKQFFPKTISDFFYNPRTENSFIFSLLGEYRFPYGMKPKLLNKDVFDFYRNEYLPNKTLSETEEISFIKISNFLHNEQKKWETLIGRYFHDHKLKGKGFYKWHKFFINKEYRDRESFNLSYLGPLTWQSFCLYLKKEFKIDIYPCLGEIEKTKKIYEELEEELERREKETQKNQIVKEHWQNKIKENHPAERFLYKKNE
jgi:hypothetical protein